MPTAPTVPERGRAAHLGPGRRRPQVLDAALALAFEGGLDAVTMANLAARLDVTRPVVYACYPSRDDVLRALLAREERRLLAEVVQALPAQPSLANPRALLVEGFTALLRTIAARPESWRVLFGAGQNAAVAASYRSARSVVARQIGPVLEAALRANGTDGLERKLPVLVDYVMAIGERAIIGVLSDVHPLTLDELAELSARFLFDALRRA